jgi:lysine 2,3-aminomutase
VKTLEKSICTIKELGDYLDLSVEEEKRLEQITQKHPMRITKYYMSLIDWNDPSDPIRRMAVPSLKEFNLQGSYDTSGEKENTKLPGLQHKYEETALILATNRCATYCRHCFRKRLVGLPSTEIIERFEEAANYIKQHDEINNVLISGGDPLVLPNEIIERFLATLSEIPHIKFIRFGSRTPVTYPFRFEDEELLRILKRNSHPNRRIYVVTQFNHPREITEHSTRAVSNLISSEVLLSNQTVLLKGVNDRPETLAALQNTLVSIGVSPYYVFQCRPVKRVKHHFQVPLCEGVRIIEEAKTKCNGHSKKFKYIMSHRTGKIEILGIMDEWIYFKYHQAKSRENLGKMLRYKADQKAGWLDDFKEFTHSSEQDYSGRPHSQTIKQQRGWHSENTLLKEDYDRGNIDFSK